MKSIRQLLRQPLKTLTGVLLIAAAVAVLCVGVGQGFASLKTQKYFEQMFTTTAVITDAYQHTEVVKRVPKENGGGFNYYYESVFVPHLPDEIRQWLEETIAAHPEIVKEVSTPGLASAYIPALTPINYSQYVNSYRDRTETGRDTSTTRTMVAGQMGAPYSCAVFEITLTEMGEPIVETTDDGERIIRMLTGTIEQVISLQEGFKSPVGYTARLTMVFPDMESATAFELTTGDRYLVYGMDYFNLHWGLAAYLSTEMEGELEDIDPYRWHVITDEEWEKYEDIPRGYGVGIYGLPDRYVWLSEWDVTCYRSITMTLENFGDFYTGTGIQEGLTEAEYRERYTVPTITRLEGTAEEFLASEEGALWRRMMENTEINNHAFPVVGVQQLTYTAEFVRGMAHLVQGRDFTEEELNRGEKVCIISKVLAEQNGLAVGDTISADFFNYDHHSPYQSFVENDSNVTQPAAYFYSEHTPFAAQETYTIIGIYEKTQVWRTASIRRLFEFTSNTIFVPEQSVTSEMAYGNLGFFYTLILENGTVDELETLETKAGYRGLLSYEDQGYSDVSVGLFDYSSMANLAFRTSAIIYTVVALLFLMLYPGRETKMLMTMHSLGATRRSEIAHVCTGSFAILLLGTALGVVGGGVLWRKLTALIPASEEVAAAYGLDLTVLLGIGAAQLLLICALTVVLALYMSRKRSGLRKDR